MSNHVFVMGLSRVPKTVLTFSQRQFKISEYLFHLSSDQCTVCINLHIGNFAIETMHGDLRKSLAYNITEYHKRLSSFCHLDLKNLLLDKLSGYVSFLMQTSYFDFVMINQNCFFLTWSHGILLRKFAFQSFSKLYICTLRFKPPCTCTCTPISFLFRAYLEEHCSM